MNVYSQMGAKILKDGDYFETDHWYDRDAL